MKRTDKNFLVINIETKAEQTVSASSIEAAMLAVTGHAVSRPFYTARGIRMYAVDGQKFGIALA